MSFIYKYVSNSDTFPNVTVTTLTVPLQKKNPNLKMRLKWEGGRDYATEEGRRSFHYSKHEFIALIFPPSDSPTLIPLAISKCVANAAARQSFSEALPQS